MNCGAYGATLIANARSLAWALDSYDFHGSQNRMYFVMLGVTPKPSNREYGVTDGAYATCWVATDDSVVAESQARSLLEDTGWDVTEVEEAYPVKRDRYLTDPSYTRPLRSG